MHFQLVNVNHPAHYFTFGPFSVSAGNLTVILFMFVVFGVALVLPFPNHEESEERSSKKKERKS